MTTKTINHNFKRFRIIIPLCLLLACSTNGKKELRPDILKYEEYGKKKIHLPRILDIKKDNKHLIYYGTEHSFDPTDSMFLDIEKRFNELKPDIAFNEGGNDWPVINDRDSTIRVTGDPGFIRYLCRINNVQIMSIEPLDSLEYKYLLTKYKKEDISLMYFCRQIDQLQNQGGISDSNFEKYMNSFLLDLKNNGLPLNNDEVKYSYMKNYYEKFFHANFNWKEFDPTNYQPIYSKTILNEIMRESTYFRDRFIINKIEETLKTNDKIFVVMGGSHLVIEEPVLRYIMNKNRQLVTACSFNCRDSVSFSVSAFNKYFCNLTITSFEIGN